MVQHGGDFAMEAPGHGRIAVMRRLLRWTFNGLAAVSLLLCVATVAFWVRSYFRFDRFGYVRHVAADKCWQVDIHPLVGLFSCNQDFSRANPAFGAHDPDGFYPSISCSHVLVTIIA